jgi:hypothetical protein
MDARTRSAGPGSPGRFPHCRVVWDGAGEVGVWVANGEQRDQVWRQRVEVIEAVADRALEQVRDEARGVDLALDAVEVLRDPRMLVPAPESGRDRDPAVYYVDFDYDADTRRTRPENPAIRKVDRTSRHDAIGELLDPGRDRTTRAARATPAARDLGRGMSQTARPTRAARAGPGVARPAPPARSQPTDRGNTLRGVSPDRKRGSRGGRGGREGR